MYDIIETLKQEKIFIILREDIKYNIERIIDIISKVNSIKFYYSKDEWIKDGSNIEILFIFNRSFLYNLEEELLEYGLIPHYIESNGVSDIGIVIEPTKVNLYRYMCSDCLSLKEYKSKRELEFLI